MVDVTQGGPVEGMTMEIQCRFVTGMPEKYQVEPTELSLSTDSGEVELTDVLKQLMIGENEDDEEFVKEIKARRFHFMINDTFLTINLKELLIELGMSNESTIDIQYLFALNKPKPTQSHQCDEWISTISPLYHIVNEKAKSYCVGMFNGDVKVYNSQR